MWLNGYFVTLREMRKLLGDDDTMRAADVLAAFRDAVSKY